jgi:hypothetical protein
MSMNSVPAQMRPFRPDLLILSPRIGLLAVVGRNGAMKMRLWPPEGLPQREAVGRRRENLGHSGKVQDDWRGWRD